MRFENFEGKSERESSKRTISTRRWTWAVTYLLECLSEHGVYCFGRFSFVSFDTVCLVSNISNHFDVSVALTLPLLVGETSCEIPHWLGENETFFIRV